MFTHRALPLLLIAAIVSACGASADTPSLAPRPMEYELSGRALPPCLADPAAAPAAAAPAPTAVDALLGAELDRLIAAARQGQSEFAAILPAAQRSTSRAGASGSESWVAAQLDLSRLEAARGRTADALTDIEALLLARSNASGTSPQDLQRVDAAAAEVRTIAETQEAELNRLSGTLSSSPSALRNGPLPAPHNERRLLAGRQAPVPSGHVQISQAAPPTAGPTGSACRG